MPQVASDPKIHAHNHTLQRQARPLQQTDQVASPFESLLDDGVPAVPQSAPQSASDKPSRAESAQPARSPGCNNDNKNAPENDTEVPTGTDAAPLDENRNDGQAASHNIADLKAEIIECTAGDYGVIAGGDDKSADKDNKTNNTTAGPPSLQTIATTDALVAPPSVTPEADQRNHVPQLPEQAAPAAHVATQLRPLDPDLLKAVVGKQGDPDKQGDAGKKADAGEQTESRQPSDGIIDNATLVSETTPPGHANGKSQAATAESDKQISIQTRGEVHATGSDGTDPSPALPADVNSSALKGIQDTALPIGSSTQTHGASNAATAAPPAPQSGPQSGMVPIAGLAIEIAGKALAGKNRFEIRLDPPELGRIDVRLDVDRDGNVTSRLTVERAHTYDLLRRDAAGLERALQDAGLKTADNGLQFSLRDQSANHEQTNGADTAQLVVQDESLPTIDVTPQIYNRLAGQGGGLDIRV